MDLLMGKSLAGHDKDAVYVVLGEDGSDVILVNGRNRTMERPKRKRKKHIQPIRRFNQAVTELARGIERWDDENVRNVIKMYLEG